MPRLILALALGGFVSLMAGCQRESMSHPVVSDVVPPSPAEQVPLKPYAALNLARIESLGTEPLPPKTPGKVSAKFPNIDLIDQDGRAVKFYDDLMRDQIVVINYFYTKCNGSCPGTTSRLKRLRADLSQEFGDKLRMISLTLNPEDDSPKELREYMKLHRIVDDPDLCRWTFATGKWEDLDLLRRALGLYELDPELDSDRTQHASIVTFGNDRTNRWAALPVGSAFDDIKTTFVRIVGDTERQRYSDAVLLGRTAHGHLRSVRSGTP